MTKRTFELQEQLSEEIKAMDAALQDWTEKAARGEANWICPDCCQNYPDGMPDSCGYGHQACTEFIQHHKRKAKDGNREQA